MNEILEFIAKRFPEDSNWLDGNCYYFALILKDRFNGKIYYDTVNCHFITQIKGKFYDWTGIIIPNRKEIFDWELLKELDPSHYNRIVRDCLL